MITSAQMNERIVIVAIVCLAGIGMVSIVILSALKISVPEIIGNITSMVAGGLLTILTKWLTSGAGTETNVSGHVDQSQGGGSGAGPRDGVQVQVNQNPEGKP